MATGTVPLTPSVRGFLQYRSEVQSEALYKPGAPDPKPQVYVDGSEKSEGIQRLLTEC